MAMIKNINGGDGSGAPTLDNVDLSQAQTMQCEKCEGKGFKQTLMLKRLSALLSPSGQEAIIPVGVFACESCGHINKEFADADIKSQ